MTAPLAPLLVRSMFFGVNKTVLLSVIKGGNLAPKMNVD